MNRPAASNLFRFPPRLSMDEYCAFIEASLRDITPEQAARQKALEERIRDRFSLGDGPAPSSLDKPRHPIPR